MGSKSGLHVNISGLSVLMVFTEKSEVVEQGNYLKFTQATDAAAVSKDNSREPTPLKQLLLATSERALVEASPFDRIWGIGFTAADAVRTLRKEWGQNLLGEALMKVRARIRTELNETSHRNESLNGSW